MANETTQVWGRIPLHSGGSRDSQMLSAFRTKSFGSSAHSTISWHKKTKLKMSHRTQNILRPTNGYLLLLYLKDTVVALEALATYSREIDDMSDLDLTVEMCLQDGRKNTVKLQKRNALTQPSIKVKVSFTRQSAVLNTFPCCSKTTVVAQ